MRMPSLHNSPGDIIRLCLLRVNAKTFYAFARLNKRLASICINSQYNSIRRLQLRVVSRHRTVFNYIEEVSSVPSGQKDGPRIHYFERDNLIKMCTYSLGEKHGLEECWHRNGRLWNRAFWIGGMKENLEETWEVNGLSHIMNWKRGLAHGEEIRWYNNGTLALVCSWDRGKRSGLEQRWYDNGVPSRQTYWIDDKEEGLESWWNSSGTLTWQCSYKQGRRDGEDIRWNSDGSLDRVCYWKDGVPCTYDCDISSLRIIRGIREKKSGSRKKRKYFIRTCKKKYPYIPAKPK